MAERATQIARELAARRRRVETTCGYCGKPITGTTRRRYCSNRCTVAAFRQRERERRAEAGGAHHG